MAKPIHQQTAQISRSNGSATARVQTRGLRTMATRERGELSKPRCERSRTAPGTAGTAFGDELLQFTTAAQGQMNGALVRCEERYPDRGHHSVLYVVVDGDREKWDSQLQGLHAEHFGPGHGDPLAPVRLEVVDRATDQAVERLIDAGLLARTSHASRSLFSAEGLSCGVLPLSDSEREKAAFCRGIAARKLKMAKVVMDAALEEDARMPLLEAILALGRAFAMEQRLPEPTLVHEALLPPISPSWGDTLSLLREFSIESGQPCRPVLEAVATLVAS